MLEGYAAAGCPPEDRDATQRLKQSFIDRYGARLRQLCGCDDPLRRYGIVFGDAGAPGTGWDGQYAWIGTDGRCWSAYSERGGKSRIMTHRDCDDMVYFIVEQMLRCRARENVVQRGLRPQAKRANRLELRMMLRFGLRWAWRLHRERAVSVDA